MKYFIKTYGCQMNKADSEKIAGVYRLKGYKPAKSIKDADVVIINSCSVRQSAEDRVLGLVNNIKKLKTKNENLRPEHSARAFGPSSCRGAHAEGLRSRELKITIKNSKLIKPKIILTGCMLRYSLYRLKKMLPEVEELSKLKDLIRNSKLVIRNSASHAWVPIMEGCDNFCTYCVVPYARGREKSKPIEEIICEVKELVKRGYKEITLLGQNVNSYAKNSKFKVQNAKLQLKIKNLQKQYNNNFAILLALLNDIKGLKKIKFLTSNPQDLTDDIIQAMKLLKVDRYLHLPVQSGDNQILKKMNRKYTAKQYSHLIKKIHQEIPNIEIGTDIIVGFPGETKKQFENTVNLCKEVGFKVAYIAKYSPRLGTAAYKLGDNVPYEEKKRRWQILDKLINK